MWKERILPVDSKAVLLHVDRGLSSAVTILDSLPSPREYKKRLVSGGTCRALASKPGQAARPTKRTGGPNFLRVFELGVKAGEPQGRNVFLEILRARGMQDVPGFGAACNVAGQVERVPALGLQSLPHTQYAHRAQTAAALFPASAAPSRESAFPASAAPS